jgi:hypothetical protein
MKPDLHPACKEWPKLSKEELLALGEDIKKQGLLEDITLMPDGTLLDGSNRWDGCELAGVEPRTVVYQGNDPVAFTISKNKHRRHQTASQLAMIVARLCKLPRGGNPFDKGIALTARKLAAESGVGVSTIEFAKSVIKNGSPNVVDMVEKGEVSTQAAAEAIKGKSKEEQAGWSREDVQREGRKKINSYPSVQKRKAASKQVAKPEPPRPGMITFPTAEETGYPVDGTFAERDEHHRKYGRTPLHPKAIADMLNHGQVVSGYVAAIQVASSDSQPSLESFFASIDAMLAWVPDHERAQQKKDANWAINFAARARNALSRLEERLPMLLERLSKLREMLEARNERA